jgi:signal transduction histidine kinase
MQRLIPRYGSAFPGGMLPRAKRLEMPSSYDRSPLVAFDARFMAASRCVLSTAVLLLLAFDPLARSRFSQTTYFILGLYVIYSFLLYAATRWGHSIVPGRIEPWVDVGWAVALTAMSGEPSGVFVEFAFFAILIAAFQWGLAPGVRITLVAAILLLSVGVALGHADADFSFQHVLTGPASLVVLGYMTASFGGQELRLKRRLALLKDVTRLSNPRFGVDRTLGMLLERMRLFYDADACLFFISEQCGAAYQFRRADRQDPERAVSADVLPGDLAHLLLAWPEHQAVVYGGGHWVWPGWPRKAGAEAVDLRRGTLLAADAKLSDAVAATLDATAFITIPLFSPYVTGGRLYLTAGRRGAFDASDVDFLVQVFAHAMPVLHNITLVDQLASDAADAERQRIALNFHDEVIQPYIGLQMGLEAVRNKLGWGAVDVTHDIQRLLHLTKDEIVQLRRMIQGLKTGGERIDRLVPAIRRFACKFSAATGIQVQVEASGAPHINDRLSAEVFHIVTEGLNNIRRHTQAATATISLAQKDGYLIVHIRNDGVDAEAFRLFSPRSITERTTALGGRVHVERQGQTHAAVITEIPL